MQKASCVVVGAGPAGSSAAYQLARAGVDVLLLDQGSFPRAKVCGDGLTPAAMGELELLGLREQVLGLANPVSGCVLYGPDGASFEATGKANGYAMPRERLDELVHRRACEAGARAVYGVNVVDAKADRKEFQLTSATGERFVCELAIVASGSHSSLPIKLGLQGKPAADAVARRAYFEGVEWKEDRLLFCYAQDLLPGYGWVFPLGGGRANVGVGYFLKPGHAPELDRVWEQFGAWLRREGVFGEKTRALSPVGTAQMRMGLRRNRLFGERVLLAGDAAAAINPLSGEGVSQALRTGRLAVEVALRALRAGNLSAKGLSCYADTVHDALPWVGGYQFAQTIMRKPALVNAAVAAARESPEVATALYDTLMGVADPRVGMRRCAMGIAETFAGRMKRAVLGG